MIKPLHLNNSPQLSAVKQRTGLQSIADLIPRLIRQYELQAELVRTREAMANRIPVAAMEAAPQQQATFGWHE